jgi:nitrogen fixation protein
MSDTIDINVYETTEEVTINVTPNVIEVNINKITGGGGGTQTLAQTLDLGNQTGGENILINNADAIELENTSSLKKGTYNFGGNGGISRICSNNYEDMWQNGFRHVFDQSGFIRNSTNCFDIVPDTSFDVTLRFKVGSIWTLDDGTSYICTDATEGAAVWEIYNSISNLVPYTGANDDVDLGEFALKAGQIELDTTPTGTASVGTTRWNDTIGSSETTLKGGNVILKNGVDLVARVVNKVTPNTTLTKADYQVVRISGAQGQRLAVNLAQANNDNNSADTLGIVTETIATNQEGFIITFGQLEGINTTGSIQSETWVDGDVLYLSPTTAGKITNIKPTGATGHIVVLGYVEYSHAVNGKIYVKIMNGWELDELHNVFISTPLNNQCLVYETSTNLWKNKTIIEDNITNGVTDKAASQNSVFDALALKQNALGYTPFKFVQTSQTAHTGTTAETIIATATINGGTFNASDVMKVLYGLNKGTTTSGASLRIRINTSNTLTGATLIGGFNVTATASATNFKRNFMLNGGNLYGVNFAVTSSVNDESNIGATYSNTTYNTANTLYLFFTIQLITSADSVTPNLFNITN